MYIYLGIYIYVIFMYNTMLLWPMWHRDPDTSTPDASTSNRFSVWSHFEAFSQALIAAFKPHWEGLLISGWLWWAKFWHKFDLMFYTIMKASFTDATLHKPVQWPQRKRRGAHGSKRCLKGSCMNQYHQTNKEEETSAMVASSCYTPSRKLLLVMT